MSIPYLVTELSITLRYTNSFSTVKVQNSCRCNFYKFLMSLFIQSFAYNACYFEVVDVIWNYSTTWWVDKSVPGIISCVLVQEWWISHFYTPEFGCYLPFYGPSLYYILGTSIIPCDECFDERVDNGHDFQMFSAPLTSVGTNEKSNYFDVIVDDNASVCAPSTSSVTKKMKGTKAKPAKRKRVKATQQVVGPTEALSPSTATSSDQGMFMHQFVVYCAFKSCDSFVTFILRRNVEVQVILRYENQHGPHSELQCISVQCTDTVAALSLRIEQLCGVPAQEQALRFDSRGLQPNKPLAHYGISLTDGGGPYFIDLHLRVCGGWDAFEEDPFARHQRRFLRDVTPPQNPPTGSEKRIKESRINFVGIATSVASVFASGIGATINTTISALNTYESTNGCSISTAVLVGLNCAICCGADFLAGSVGGIAAQGIGMLGVGATGMAIASALAAGAVIVGGAYLAYNVCSKLEQYIKECKSSDSCKEISDLSGAGLPPPGGGGDGDGGDGGGGGGDDGGLGGVDLRGLTEISGFDDNLISVLDFHTIAVPLDIDWELVKQLIPKILSPGVTATPAQFAQTILNELLDGVLVHDSLPFFSLHFNNDGVLYPIMPECYRSTVTITVMGYLDYFLKGFVNGGTYTEKVIRSWDGVKMSPEYARTHVVDIRQHFRNFGLGSVDYQVVREMCDDPTGSGDYGDDDGTEEEEGGATTGPSTAKGTCNAYTSQPYHSAFRIIGKCQGVSMHDGVIFPDTGIDVEHDLNPTPAKAAELNAALLRDGVFPKSYANLVSAYNRMHGMIQQNMRKVPMFAPYFEVFKLITFLVSYVITLQRNGKLPDAASTKKALKSNMGGLFPDDAPYCPPFVKAMPPIPVRVNIKFPVNITCRDLISSLRIGLAENVQCPLDVNFERMILGTQGEISPGTDAEIQLRMLALAQRRLLPLIGQADLNTRTERELRVPLLCAHVKIIIRQVLVLPAESLEKNMFRLIDLTIEQLESQGVSNTVLSASLAEIRRLRSKMTSKLRTRTFPQKMQYLRGHVLAKITATFTTLVATVRSTPNDQLYQPVQRQEMERVIRDRAGVVFDSRSGHAEARARNPTVYAREKVRWQDHCVQDTFSADTFASFCTTALVGQFQSNLESILAKIEMMVRLITLYLCDAEHPDPVYVPFIRLSALTTDHTSSGWDNRITGGCVIRYDHKVALRMSSEHAAAARAIRMHQQSAAGCSVEGESYCQVLIQPADPQRFWLVGVHLKDDFLFSPEIYLLERRGCGQDVTTAASVVRILSQVRQQPGLPKDVVLDDVHLKQLLGGQGADLAHMVATTSEVAALGLVTVVEANQPLPNGLRPIHKTCITGSLKMAQALVAKGVRLLDVMSNGQYALLLALQNNFPEIAMLLLQSNQFAPGLPDTVINVSKALDSGMTPLHWAVHFDNVNSAHKLVTLGAVLNCSRRRDGFTPAHLAAAMNRAECLAAMVRQPGFNINAKIDGGATCLHLAAKNGAREAVQFILSCATVDVTALDSVKNTALFLATQFGHLEVAVLIAKKLVQSSSLSTVLKSENNTLLLATSVNAQSLLFHFSCAQNSGVIGGLRQTVSSLGISLTSALTLNHPVRPASQTHFSADGITVHNFSTLLCTAMRANDVHGARRLVTEGAKRGIGYHIPSCIKAAVASRNLEILAVLSRLVDLTTPGAAIFMVEAAKAGLDFWVPELKIYGIPLLHSSDTQTALSVAAELGDLAVVSAILLAIDVQQEGGALVRVLPSIIKMAAELNNFPLLATLLQHLQDKKFHALLEHVHGAAFLFNMCHTSLCTLRTIGYFDKLKLGNTRTLVSCEAAAASARTSVFATVLRGATEEHLKAAFCFALYGRRIDNLRYLCSSYPGIHLLAECQEALAAHYMDPLVVCAGSGDFTEIDRRLSSIAHVLQHNECAELEKVDASVTNGPRSSLKALLEGFPIGNMAVHDKEPLLHCIVKNDCMWALPLLPSDYDIGYKTDEGMCAFDYLPVLSDVTGSLKSVWKFLLDRFNNREEAVARVLFDLMGDTMKQVAQMRGSEKSLLNALLAVVPPITRTPDGNTLFHVMADLKCNEQDFAGVLSTVERTLSAEAKLQLLNSADKFKRTPLMAFATNAGTKTVLRLVGLGVDVCSQDIAGNTALHLLLRCAGAAGKEGGVSAGGGIEMFINCVAAMCRVDPWCAVIANREGLTPWMLAAEAGIPAVMRLFMQYFPIAQLEQPCSNTGMKAIHYAAKLNRNKVLKFLVHYARVPVDSLTTPQYVTDRLKARAKFFEGYTALCFAGEAGLTAAFQQLLELGADPFHTTRSEATPMLLAASHGDPVFFKAMRPYCAFQAVFPHPMLLAHLISNELADVYQLRDVLSYVDPNSVFDHSGNPLLHIAVRNSNTMALECLLYAGASITVRDRRHRTAFHEAVAECDSSACLGLLLQFSSKHMSAQERAALLDAVDIDGNTALHLACKFGKLSSCVRLMQHLPHDLRHSYTQNKMGLSPVAFALVEGNASSMEVVSFLCRVEERLGEFMIASLREEHRPIVAALFDEQTHLPKATVLTAGGPVTESLISTVRTARQKLRGSGTIAQSGHEAVPSWAMRLHPAIYALHVALQEQGICDLRDVLILRRFNGVFSHQSQIMLGDACCNYRDNTDVAAAVKDLVSMALQLQVPDTVDASFTATAAMRKEVLRIFEQRLLPWVSASHIPAVVHEINHLCSLSICADHAVLTWVAAYITPVLGYTTCGTHVKNDWSVLLQILHNFVCFLTDQNLLSVLPAARMPQLSATSPNSSFKHILAALISTDERFLDLQVQMINQIPIPSDGNGIQMDVRLRHHLEYLDGIRTSCNSNPDKFWRVSVMQTVNTVIGNRYMDPTSISAFLQFISELFDAFTISFDSTLCEQVLQLGVKFLPKPRTAAPTATPPPSVPARSFSYAKEHTLPPAGAVTKQKDDLPAKNADFSRYISSWALVARELSTLYGAGFVVLLMSAVERKLNKSDYFSSSKLQLFDVVSTAAQLLELDDVTEAKSCLDALHRDFWSDLALRNLRTRVVQSRRSLYGEDREIDDLLAAFERVVPLVVPDTVAGSSMSAAEAEAAARNASYLRTFDGTPEFPLPANTIRALRTVYSHMEKYCAPPTANSLRTRGWEIGAQYRRSPTLQTMAQLICIVREGCRIALHMRPFNSQCLVAATFMHPERLAGPNTDAAGARAVNRGLVLQAGPGEGKSLMIAMTVVLHVLQGLTVDVITTSDNLAQRDAEKFKVLYDLFGISSGFIILSQKLDDFNRTVLYGKISDFEHALLNDKVYLTKKCRTAAGQSAVLVERQANVYIIDEMDSLLFEGGNSASLIGYKCSMRFEWIYSPIYHRMEEVPDCSLADMRSYLSGYSGGRYSSTLEAIADPTISKLMRSAVSARTCYKLGKDYRLQWSNEKQRTEVVIVSYDSTGRGSVGSRWIGGLHEMVEVKEGIPVKPQNGSVASIAHSTYNKRPQLLLCFTGTVGEVAERAELKRIHDIDSYDIPPNKPCIRVRWPTQLFPTAELKIQAIIRRTQEMVAARRPILVLLLTMEDTVAFSGLLRVRGIPHNVLNDHVNTVNGRPVLLEDDIVRRAGWAGAVTIATNAAGRGTDIPIEGEALRNGGLHVTFGFLPAGLRPERQGLNRCGRLGQPGTNEIFISEDEDTAAELLKRYFDRKAAATFYSGTVAADNNDVASAAAVTQEKILALYSERTATVQATSSHRIVFAAVEEVRYACLSAFFADLSYLDSYLKCPECQCSINQALFARRVPGAQLNVGTSTPTTAVADDGSADNDSGSGNGRNSSSNGLSDVSEFAKRLLDCFRIKWTDYFTALCDTESSEVLVKAAMLGPVHFYAEFLEQARWTLTRDSKPVSLVEFFRSLPLD